MTQPVTAPIVHQTAADLTVFRGHIEKAERDLQDAQRALTRWYDHGSAEAREDDMHHAAEALMRAVATLAQAVEQIGGRQA